jgi:uncharacterized membrane protein
MLALVAGLVVFLGVHSIGILAPRWRNAQVMQMGERRWKGVFSLVSIAGFVLLVWGYGRSPSDPVALWTPPAWAPHATALLAVVAFILVVSAYVPGTHFRSALGYPMTVGVGVWALGHLLSNATPRDVVLFGAFLVWSIAVFATRRRRDQAAGVAYAAGHVRQDVIAIVAGVVGALVFALFLHAPLIGVRPFG